MPVYVFRARDVTGRVVEGSLEAADDREAVRQLRQRNLVPTRLAVEAPRAGRARPAPAARRARVDLRHLFGRRVGLKSLALFCRQFATMIGSGLAILVSLRVIADQTGDRVLQQVLRDVAERLEAGESLSDAFGRHVPAIPPLVVHMIQAGEAGGILEEVFSRLADHFEREHALSEKVRSALLYPKVVLAAAAGLLMLLLSTVLPTFVALFAQFDAELPLVTRLVLAAGQFTRDHLAALVAAAAAGYGAYAVAAGRGWGRERLDALALRLPVLGELYLKRSLARFTRTLGTLLESGVPILTALRVAEKVLECRPLERMVAEARENVRAGRALAGPLRDGKLFPRMVVEMVAVGEETGALDTMLHKAADFYEQETASLVQRLTSLLEPAIVVAVGSVVAVIVASVFLPLYQLLSAIR